MKKILIIIPILLFNICVFSQEIKIKNDIVYVDDKECLKIDVSDANNITFSDLEGNEIVFLKYIHDTKIHDTYVSLYNKITFIQQKKSFTSKDYIYTKALLVKRLINEKILENCKINSSKLDVFIMKFDENVEDYSHQ